MSDESKLGEIESQDPLAAYQDQAAELQDIVRSVARLRRWSHFSVLWILAGCLCVFGAILFALFEPVQSKAGGQGINVEAEAWACTEEKAALRRTEEQVAELRRENDELKRAAVSESRELNVWFLTGRSHVIGRRPSLRATAGGGSAENASSLSLEAVVFKIQSDYMAGLKRCYREYLKKDASARGQISLSLTVNETVNGAAYGFAPEVDECITSQMSTWRFPIPKDKDGETTDASFYIEFRLVPD